jgi:hypothetical protein
VPEIGATTVATILDLCEDGNHPPLVEPVEQRVDSQLYVANDARPTRIPLPREHDKLRRFALEHKTQNTIIESALVKLQFETSFRKIIIIKVMINALAVTTGARARLRLEVSA